MKELVKPQITKEEDPKVEALLTCSFCYSYTVGSGYCTSYSSPEEDDDILF